MTDNNTPKLRPGMPDLPARMKTLPVDERGYPVPYFVQWLDDKPEFRMTDPLKLAKCIRFGHCWICGEVLGRWKTFVGGTVGGVSRISAEPPSHLDCAQFATKVCPFLVLPKAKRREANMPEHINAPGHIDRNPGVTLLWICDHYDVVRTNDGGGILMRMGEPTSIECWKEAREASPIEVRESLEGGLPYVRQTAHGDPIVLVRIERAIDRFVRILTAHGYPVILGPH